MTKLYEKRFLKRLRKLGIKEIILSWDTLVFIIVFFSIWIATNGIIIKETADDILLPFMEISASLFAIVLAGLAIVTSFTDKEFVYAWVEADAFDEVITIFQYNMYLPLLVLLISLFLRFILYNSIVMIVLVALFAYMIASLIDLVNFVSRYGLQRGEFIKLGRVTALQEQLSELQQKIEPKETKKKTRKSKKK